MNESYSEGDNSFEWLVLLCVKKITHYPMDIIHVVSTFVFPKKYSEKVLSSNLIILLLSFLSHVKVMKMSMLSKQESYK